MLTKKRLILKSIAATLCIVFISSELRAAPIDIPQNISSQEVILNHPQQFEAPLDFASLSDIHPGENGKFIIHIQDAHSNFLAQDNLAGALRELMGKYNIRLVLSEGGYGDCTLSDLRDKAKPELVKQVARSFLRSGEIHGEEYLNLTDKRPMKIIGIEDKALYEEGLKYYEELADKREKVLGYLVRSRNAIEKLKVRLYPKELVDYERAGLARQNTEWNIEEYLKLAAKENLDLSAFSELLKLAEIKKSEEAIDFESANLEQSVLIEELFKKGAKETLESYLSKMKQMKGQSAGGKVSQFAYFEKTLSIAKEKGVDTEKFPNFLAYVEYLKKFSGLNFDTLLHEFDRAEDGLYKKVLSDYRLQTRDQRLESLQSPVSGLQSESDDAFLLRAVDRFILLLQTAHQIQMTADQFALFKYNEPDFSTEAMQAFLNRKLAEQGYFEDMIPYEPLLEDARKTLDQFYGSVKRRDTVFMRNLESAMKDEDQKVAFLISGGYHTPHLKEMLRGKGYGYSVLTPIVTTETNQKKYESLLLNKNDKAKKKVHVVNGESRAQDKPLGALDDDLEKLIKKKDKMRDLLVANDPLTGARLAEALGVSDYRQVTRSQGHMSQVTRSPGHQSPVTGENLRTPNFKLRTNIPAGARMALEPVGQTVYWRNMYIQILPHMQPWFGKLQGVSADALEFAGHTKPYLSLRLEMHLERSEPEVDVIFQDHRTGYRRTTVISTAKFAVNGRTRNVAIPLWDFEPAQEFLDGLWDIPREFGVARAAGIRDFILHHSSDKADARRALGLGGNWLALPNGIKTGNLLIDVIRENPAYSRYALLVDQLNPSHFVALEVRSKKLYSAATGMSLPAPDDNNLIPTIEMDEINNFYFRASRALRLGEKKGNQTAVKLGSANSSRFSEIGLPMGQSFSVIKVDRSNLVSPTGSSHSGRREGGITVRGASDEWGSYPILIADQAITASEVVGADVSPDEIFHSPKFLPLKGDVQHPFIGYGDDNGYLYYKRMNGSIRFRDENFTVYRRLDLSDPNILIKAQMSSDDLFSIDGVKWKIGPLAGQPVNFRGRLNAPLFVAKYAGSDLMDVPPRLIGALDSNQEITVTSQRRPIIDISQAGALTVVAGERRRIKDYSELYQEARQETKKIAELRGARLAENENRHTVTEESQGQTTLAASHQPPDTSENTRSAGASVSQKPGQAAFVLHVGLAYTAVISYVAAPSLLLVKAAASVLMFFASDFFTRTLGLSSNLPKPLRLAVSLILTLFFTWGPLGQLVERNRSDIPPSSKISRPKGDIRMVTPVDSMSWRPDLGISGEVVLFSDELYQAKIHIHDWGGDGGYDHWDKVIIEFAPLPKGQLIKVMANYLDKEFDYHTDGGPNTIVFDLLSVQRMAGVVFNPQELLINIATDQGWGTNYDILTGRNLVPILPPITRVTFVKGDRRIVAYGARPAGNEERHKDTESQGPTSPVNSENPRTPNLPVRQVGSGFQAAVPAGARLSSVAGLQKGSYQVTLRRAYEDPDVWTSQTDKGAYAFKMIRASSQTPKTFLAQARKLLEEFYAADKLNEEMAAIQRDEFDHVVALLLSGERVVGIYTFENQINRLGAIMVIPEFRNATGAVDVLLEDMRSRLFENDPQARFVSNILRLDKDRVNGGLENRTVDEFKSDLGVLSQTTVIKGARLSADLRQGIGSHFPSDPTASNVSGDAGAKKAADENTKDRSIRKDFIPWDVREWVAGTQEEEIYQLWNFLADGDQAQFATLLSELSPHILYHRVIANDELKQIPLPKDPYDNPRIKHAQKIGQEITDRLAKSLVPDRAAGLGEAVAIENVIQHAVTKGGEGHILVYRESGDMGDIYIYILDSGPGMPVDRVIEGKHQADTKGFGRGIRSLLANQLGQPHISNWIYGSQGRLWDGEAEAMKDSIYAMPKKGSIFARRLNIDRRAGWSASWKAKYLSRPDGGLSGARLASRKEGNEVRRVRAAQQRKEEEARLQSRRRFMMIAVLAGTAVSVPSASWWIWNWWKNRVVTAKRNDLWMNFHAEPNLESAKKFIHLVAEWLRANNYPRIDLVDAYVRSVDRNAIANLDMPVMFSKSQIRDSSEVQIILNPDSLADGINDVISSKNQQLFLYLFVATILREAWGANLISHFPDHDAGVIAKWQTLQNELNAQVLDEASLKKILLSRESVIRDLEAEILAKEFFEAMGFNQFLEWAESARLFSDPKLEAFVSGSGSAKWQIWHREHAQLYSARLNGEELLSINMALLARIYRNNIINGAGEIGSLAWLTYIKLKSIQYEQSSGKEGLSSSDYVALAEQRDTGPIPSSFMRPLARELYPFVERFVNEWGLSAHQSAHGARLAGSEERFKVTESQGQTTSVTRHQTPDTRKKMVGGQKSGGGARLAVSPNPVSAVEVYTDKRSKLRIRWDSIPDGSAKSFLNFIRHSDILKNHVMLFGGAVRDLILDLPATDIDYSIEGKMDTESLASLRRIPGVTVRVESVGDPKDLDYTVGPNLTVNRMALYFDDGDDPILLDRDGGYYDLLNRRGRLSAEPDFDDLMRNAPTIVEKMKKYGLYPESRTKAWLDGLFAAMNIDTLERTDPEMWAILKVYRGIVGARLAVSPSDLARSIEAHRERSRRLSPRLTHYHDQLLTLASLISSQNLNSALALAKKISKWNLPGLQRRFIRLKTKQLDELVKVNTGASSTATGDFALYGARLADGSKNSSAGLEGGTPDRRHDKSRREQVSAVEGQLKELRRIVYHVNSTISRLRGWSIPEAHGVSPKLNKKALELLRGKLLESYPTLMFRRKIKPNDRMFIFYMLGGKGLNSTIGPAEHDRIIHKRVNKLKQRMKNRESLPGAEGPELFNSTYKLTSFRYGGPVAVLLDYASVARNKTMTYLTSRLKIEQNLNDEDLQRIGFDSVVGVSSPLPEDAREDDDRARLQLYYEALVAAKMARRKSENDPVVFDEAEFNRLAEEALSIRQELGLSDTPAENGLVDMPSEREMLQVRGLSEEEVLRKNDGDMKARPVLIKRYLDLIDLFDINLDGGDTKEAESVLTAIENELSSIDSVDGKDLKYWSDLKEQIEAAYRLLSTSTKDPGVSSGMRFHWFSKNAQMGTLISADVAHFYEKTVKQAATAHWKYIKAETPQRTASNAFALALEADAGIKRMMTQSRIRAQERFQSMDILVTEKLGNGKERLVASRDGGDEILFFSPQELTGDQLEQIAIIGNDLDLRLSIGYVPSQDRLVPTLVDVDGYYGEYFKDTANADNILKRELAKIKDQGIRTGLIYSKPDESGAMRRTFYYVGADGEVKSKDVEGARLADLSYDEFAQQLPILIEQARSRIVRLNLKPTVVRIDVIGVVTGDSAPSLYSDSPDTNAVTLSNIRELILRHGGKLEDMRFTLNRAPEKYGLDVTVRGIAPTTSEGPRQVSDLRQEGRKDAGARLALGGNPRVGGLAGVASDEKNPYSTLLKQLNPHIGNTSTQYDLPGLSRLTQPLRYPKMIVSLQVLKRRFGAENPANVLVVGPGIDGNTNTSPQMAEIFNVFKNVARYTVIDKFAQVNQAVARSVPREMATPNIGYVVAPIQEVKDFGADQLDVIVATNSLMYVNSTEMEKHELLSRLVRALRPNGKLFIGFYDYLTLHSVKERAGIVQSIIDSDHQGLKLRIDKLIQVIGLSHGINISVGGDFANNGIIEISRLPLNSVGSDATAPESPGARLSAETEDEQARWAAKDLRRDLRRDIDRLNAKLFHLSRPKVIQNPHKPNLVLWYKDIHRLAEKASTTIETSKQVHRESNSAGGVALITAISHGGDFAKFDIKGPLSEIFYSLDPEQIIKQDPETIRGNIKNAAKAMARIRQVLKALEQYVADTSKPTEFIEAGSERLVDMSPYLSGARLASDMSWVHVISDVLFALNGGLSPSSLDLHRDRAVQLNERRDTIARMIVDSRDEIDTRKRMKQAYFVAYGQFFGAEPVTEENIPEALRAELEDIERRVDKLKAERSAEQTEASATPASLGARLGARRVSPFGFAVEKVAASSSQPAAEAGARLADRKSPGATAPGVSVEESGVRSQESEFAKSLFLNGARLSSSNAMSIDEGSLSLLALGMPRFRGVMSAAVFYFAFAGGVAPIALAAPSGLNINGQFIDMSAYSSVSPIAKGEPTSGAQDVMTRAAVNEYTNLINDGLRKLPLFGDGPVLIVRPVSGSEEAAQIEMTLRAMRSRLPNAYFEFYDARTGARLAHLSSDPGSLPAHAKTVYLAEATNANLEAAISRGARFASTEPVDLKNGEMAFLPLGAALIAAVIIGRLDSIQGKDLLVGFFRRLTKMNFGQSQYQLYVKPSIDKLSELVSIKALAWLQISEALTGARMALEAISHAA